jgi:uncharacterized protein YecE (DUF72 family)
MKTIAIGTSGYSYPEWVGPVYPKGTPAKDYLSKYSELFNFTELNFTYYRQPDPHTTERLAGQTPDTFRFCVKAYQGLTHHITDNIIDESKKFKYGIAPLIEASKLSAILFQFPFSFHYTSNNRKHLHLVCDEFSGMPLAVEFRNNGWLKESVFTGLQKRGAGFVNVDEPDLQGLIPATDIVTSPLAYVRFHGRNREKWWNGDNATRYDYLYNNDELSEWVPRIKSMAEKAPLVLVAFNNHWRGKAVANALKFKEMIA